MEGAPSTVTGSAQDLPERQRVRLEAEGRDNDQARTTLSAFYDGSEWSTRPTGPGYSYRYAAVGDGAMTLRTSEMRGYIEGDVPPGDDFIVQWITQGSAVVDLGRDEIPLTIGRPQLFPAHRPFVFGFTDYRQKLVHLGRQRVRSVAAERTGGEASGARFDHTASPSDAAIALWHDSVALASRALARGDELSPLLWHELSRMVTVAFLELYPPHRAELPPALLAPRHARIRAVVEHVHEHAHLPLTPTELAEVAGLSVRALQDAFQRTLGMPPLAYLRQVRLDRAHAELGAADPTSTSVGEVARRWGFAHLGRFSAYYAERFGVPPSETLRGTRLSG